jgi:hypothetical protein
MTTAIYAGAPILSRIATGRGSSIGGNVWLTESAPRVRRITQAKTRAIESAKARTDQTFSLPMRGDAREFLPPPERSRPNRAGAVVPNRPEYLRR